jgi:hypothetical protein
MRLIILDGEIKPLIVAMSIGIILDKKNVLVGFL